MPRKKKVEQLDASLILRGLTSEEFANANSFIYRGLPVKYLTFNETLGKYVFMFTGVTSNGFTISLTSKEVKAEIEST